MVCHDRPLLDGRPGRLMRPSRPWLVMLGRITIVPCRWGVLVSGTYSVVWSWAACWLCGLGRGAPNDTTRGLVRYRTGPRVGSVCRLMACSRGTSSLGNCEGDAVRPLPATSVARLNNRRHLHWWYGLDCASATWVVTQSYDNLGNGQVLWVLWIDGLVNDCCHSICICGLDRLSDVESVTLRRRRALGGEGNGQVVC